MPHAIRLSVLGLLACFSTAAQTAPLLNILSEELDRNFLTLSEKADPPAYYIAYEVVDRESQSLSSTLGTLEGGSPVQTRLLDVTVRVGDRKLDNYHRLPGDRPQFTSAVALSLEDNPNAIRRSLWLQTDRVYRLGTQRLIKIRSESEANVAREDLSDDFSVEPPVVASSDPPPFRFDASAWGPRLRRLSSQFSHFPTIVSSSVAVSAERETKYLVNTEGTRLKHGRGFARVTIVARAKAADGMDLATTEDFEAEDASRLPEEKTLKAAVERVATQLEALLSAPVVDPYVGPAILSGRASGVFFHEIFGHRIEGHRQKDESEGQTFTKSLEEPVLPEFLSVSFDPTLHRQRDVDLNGWYDYDDEGVKARRIAIVDKGILKTFLLSRSPIKGFFKSNGHGRRASGAEVVSRQSNLIVESSNSVPEAKLRQMLIDEVKRQGKPYGLYFDQVTGGYTTTSRRGMQGFKVIPLVVYRVYPDGRPDELVRGADIVGTPLSSFAKILATSDKTDVFNGICGAESGNVPVAAVSPAILVSELEIQKTEKSQDRPPLLPRPSAGGRR